jgi:hypothetical protein
MRYAIVFFAGMVAPYVAWLLFVAIDEYVYMPLIWEPRHRRWCRRTATPPDPGRGGEG